MKCLEMCNKRLVLQGYPPVTFLRLKKSFKCYRYNIMRLFSNSNEVQAPYAPIFDGRLLLGMSLFSKKYSIHGICECATTFEKK